MDLEKEIHETELILNNLLTPGLQTWWELKMLQINYKNGFFIPEEYFKIILGILRAALIKIRMN